jgi:hypothetical protein
MHSVFVATIGFAVWGGPRATPYDKKWRRKKFILCKPFIELRWRPWAMINHRLLVQNKWCKTEKKEKSEPRRVYRILLPKTFRCTLLDRDDNRWPISQEDKEKLSPFDICVFLHICLDLDKCFKTLQILCCYPFYVQKYPTLKYCIFHQVLHNYLSEFIPLVFLWSVRKLTHSSNYWENDKNDWFFYQNLMEDTVLQS